MLVEIIEKLVSPTSYPNGMRGKGSKLGVVV